MNLEKQAEHKASSGELIQSVGVVIHGVFSWLNETKMQGLDVLIGLQA
jgi:hypothetical protein